MNILDVALAGRIAAGGGGGGGSGTDNYNDLSNLPQINGETLAGNKTAENLGLQDVLTFDSTPTEDSTNPVESGGVYTALAGKQDNLTFDDDPTENSTNPVKSGGVYSALAGKQDNLTFDGVYNASTNKAATESTVTNAIAGLDVSDFSVDADETISSISETDGKISVTKQDIAIASNQVVAMTGYTKPSSAPVNPAIQTNDTANQAFGKLEFNILYTMKRTGENYLPVTSGTVNNGNIMKLEPVYIKAGYYTFSFKAATGFSGAYEIDFYHADGTTKYAIQGQVSSSVVRNFQLTDDIYYVTLYFSGAVTVSEIMVCHELRYNADNSFVDHSLPNCDLTHLQAEDRAALAERIDAGVKGLVPLTWTNTDPFPDINLTQNNDGSVTVKATNTAATRIITFADSINYYLTVGKKYVLSGCNGGDYETTYGFALSTSNFTGRVFEEDGSTEFTYTSSDVVNFTLVVRAGQTWTKTFYPMICDAPAWKLSPKYAPYSFLIKGDMWAEKYETRSTTLTSTGIKFIAPRQTIYRITATALDNGGHPTEIAIKWAILPSSTESFLTRVTRDSNSVSLTTIAIVTLGVGGYFEVYASYENATSNRVYAIVEEVVLKPF